MFDCVFQRKLERESIEIVKLKEYTHYADIFKHECVIENRVCDSKLSVAELKTTHKHNWETCQKYGLDYILIDNTYDIDHYAEIVCKEGCQL